LAATGSLETLTVVVTNFETPDLTIRSVGSLLEDGVPAGRIVVVDNGSTDDSAKRFEQAIPGCVHVRLHENVGFARGTNDGARALAGSAYMFVNSDAFVRTPGTVRRMLDALDDPTVGIVVPRLRNEDGTLQRNVVPVSRPAVALVRASGLSRFVPNRWQPRWSTHWDHASTREVEAADGAVLLVRGSTWHELGGYDEAMWMYAEDLDLCWRTRKLGQKVCFVHEAEFVHLGGGTSRHHWPDPRRAELVGRSEARMIRANLPPVSARLSLAFMSAGLAARWLLFTLRRNSRAAATMRGSLRGIAEGRRGPPLRPRGPGT
jgi:GT2 family glycosyltransferase